MQKKSVRYLSAVAAILVSLTFVATSIGTVAAMGSGGITVVLHPGSGSGFIPYQYQQQVENTGNGYNQYSYNANTATGLVNIYAKSESYGTLQNQWSSHDQKVFNGFKVYTFTASSSGTLFAAAQWILSDQIYGVGGDAVWPDTSEIYIIAHTEVSDSQGNWLTNPNDGEIVVHKQHDFGPLNQGPTTVYPNTGAVSLTAGKTYSIYTYIEVHTIAKRMGTGGSVYVWGDLKYNGNGATLDTVTIFR